MFQKVFLAFQKFYSKNLFRKFYSETSVMKNFILKNIILEISEILSRKSCSRISYLLVRIIYIFEN